MATVNNPNAEVQGRPNVETARPYLIDTTVNSGAINAGDQCYFTSNNGVASFGSGLTLNAALVALLKSRVGVSKDTNPIGGAAGVGGIQNPLIYAGIFQNGLFAFNTTNGDTYKDRSPVTIGTDAQTITLAPVGPTPVSTIFACGAVTGGTLIAGTHIVTCAWISALGETLVGPSLSVTATAGQGLIYTYNGTGFFVFPAWAIGVAVYIDGLLAGVMASAPTANVNFTGPTSSKVAPLYNALAIGVVELPTGATAGSANIAGGTGITVPVRIIPVYPAPSLI